MISILDSLSICLQDINHTLWHWLIQVFDGLLFYLTPLCWHHFPEVCGVVIGLPMSIYPLRQDSPDVLNQVEVRRSGEWAIGGPKSLPFEVLWYAIINCTALVAKLYWYDTDWEWKIETLYFWYDLPFSHFDTSLIHRRHFWEISMEFPVLIAEIPGDTKRHFYTWKRKLYLPMMSPRVMGCK